MVLELLSVTVIWPPAIAFLVVCFFGFHRAVGPQPKHNIHHGGTEPQSYTEIQSC
jgi:hypothetical protein